MMDSSLNNLINKQEGIQSIDQAILELGKQQEDIVGSNPKLQSAYKSIKNIFDNLVIDSK